MNEKLKSGSVKFKNTLHKTALQDERDTRKRRTNEAVMRADYTARLKDDIQNGTEFEWKGNRYRIAGAQRPAAIATNKIRCIKLTNGKVANLHPKLVWERVQEAKGTGGLDSEE